MTPEQRLDRVENILRGFARAGRRAREEWNYKINSLIDAQVRHETVWRIQWDAIKEQFREVAAAQARNEKEIAELARSHELTEKSLRAFIDSLRKGGNGNSST